MKTFEERLERAGLAHKPDSRRQAFEMGSSEIAEDSRGANAEKIGHLKT